MNKPLEIIKRNAFYSALSGLMLVALFLMTGCEAPSGTPGARPGMVPGASPRPGVPGAPGAGGRPLSAKPNGAKAPFNKSSISNNVGTPKVPNMNPATLNPTQPAIGIAGKKPENQKPGVLPKVPGALSGDAGVNSLASTSKVEQAGNTVNLASEIVVAGTNPFLNRLPKPVEIATTEPGEGTTTENVPAPVDPFESISLLGIAYHAKVPMALISVGGGESQTQMVRKGDVVMMDGGQVKVSSIGPESIEFEKAGTEKSSSEKRTFSLPSIIGYGSSSASSGASEKTSEKSGMDAESPSDKSTKEMPASKNPRDSHSKQTDDLPNLSKLSSESKSSKPSAGDGKSNDVVLKEP